MRRLRPPPGLAIYAMKTIPASLCALVLTFSACGRKETHDASSPPPPAGEGQLPAPAAASGQAHGTPDAPKASDSAVPDAQPPLPKVVLGYQVGVTPRKASATIQDLAKEHRESLTWRAAHPDPVIPFSKLQADFDDFCRAELDAHRIFLVYEPSSSLYYQCVADQRAQWVAIPSFTPLTGKEAMWWGMSTPLFRLDPSGVVGRSQPTFHLPPGERRVVYMDR